jgi:hypothetical protein
MGLQAKLMGEKTEFIVMDPPLFRYCGGGGGGHVSKVRQHISLFLNLEKKQQNPRFRQHECAVQHRHSDLHTRTAVQLNICTIHFLFRRISNQTLNGQCFSTLF